LRQALEEALELRVHVDGDARALALAEGSFGGARGESSYVSMVVSTGVGGAIVLDGRLLDGETGNAGHIGHLNVVPQGRLCACGSYGCLEAEASGRAIEDMTGRPAVEADEATRTRCAELVGRAVGTLAAVLDFSHCYLAGSVALGFGEDFFHVANKAARAVAMMHYSSHVELRRSPLGADGPILGAAMVGWRGERA
jgi:glucokinase